ncbi:MAG: type IV secretory system conjugative DNA transfer family protein [Rhodoferax sp.]|nr:type IV secretory system conjugative DNA transfer family protein [Rhodoferax sp.]
MASQQRQQLYVIRRAQGDITRFVWVAFLIFGVVTALTFVLVTQYTAWQFRFHPTLGSPTVIFGQTRIYWPWDILIWIFRYFRPDSSPDVLSVIKTAQLMLAAGAMTAIVFPVAYVFRRTRKLKDERNDLHGSAHWAVAEEIEAAGILPSPENMGGVMLGAVDIPLKNDGFNPFGTKTKTVYLRHNGPEHILVFAPTRSGKGVGIVMPTLLSWSESVLVHDIKGENWALTSGFRERVLKQRCLRFSPSETDSARFNPLSEIRLDDNLVKDVQNVSTMIVDPDGKGLQDHWAKTGFDLMTGVIIFVLVSDELEDAQRNMSTVQAILSDGGPVRELAERLAADKDTEADVKTKIAEGFRAVMEYIRDTGYERIMTGLCTAVELVAWKTASQAAQSFLNKASNEASGVLSTALSFLSLYRDPIVAANTSASDFTIESLMQRPTSLYLVVPPSDKDRLKPLLRLVINQVVRRLTEKMEFDETGASKSRFPHKMLLLIDEFPALGKLEIFEEALAFIAGYGLKALLITQDLSQLTKAYSKDESILSNCHIRIAFAPNKIETAELLSKMSGASTVAHTQRNFSGSRLSVVLNNVSTNEQLSQRPLLTPDETMRLPPADELVFVAGHAPIYCQKIIYYKDAALVKRQWLGAAKRIGNAVIDARIDSTHS